MEYFNWLGLGHMTNSRMNHGSDLSTWTQNQREMVSQRNTRALLLEKGSVDIQTGKNKYLFN